MSFKSASASVAPESDQAGPVRFDRRRLIDALLNQRRLLVTVALIALFGGGLVAKLAVPLDYAAEVRLSTAARDVPITLAAHAPSRERALELAQDAGERFIREADASFGGARAASYRARDQARQALEQARTATATAMAAEGVTDLRAESIAIDAQIRERERERSAVSGEAVEAAARKDVLEATTRRFSRRDSEELAGAQRAMSMAMAQENRDETTIRPLQQRIQRLMARSAAPLSASVSQRATARAHESRVAQLDQELAALRQKRASLLALRTRYADVLAREQQAEQRLATSEASALTFDHVDARVRWVDKPHVTHVEGRALRAAVAVVTPALALFLAVLLVLLNEVRDLRVMSSRELAHWLRLPVVGISRWPGDPTRLEALIDELSEHAIEARGTTLILCGDENERPLATAIAAQLNARAQRHFRSATGARVAVAQAWKGDLSGAHVRRAAAVADRVLWVISAGSYRGPELRARRADVPRAEGVAALMVDVPHRRMPSEIGDVAKFWASESTYTPERLPQHSERVPLH